MALHKVGVPSHAACVQTSGKVCMNQLAQELSTGSLSSSDCSNPLNSEPSNIAPTICTVSDKDLHEQDLAVANKEL